MQFDRDRVALAAFVGEAVLAGGNAVGVRFSNRELDPLWGAALRFSLAALLLGAVMAVLRLPFPRGSALIGALLYGVVIFGGAFGLAYYALVRIHAGLGQTLLALVPLATLLLAVVQRQERLRAAAVLGTLLAVAGIAVISGLSERESVPLLSLLAVLGGVLCFAQGTVLVRHFPAVHPVTLNAVEMATGAAILLTLSVLVGESVVLPERAATWLALAYMVALGSGVVFVLYAVIIRLWSASRAAYTFVLAPIVTVVLSAWLDNEPIGAGLVFGGVLVLAGVYIGALRPARVPSLPSTPPPPLLNNLRDCRLVTARTRCVRVLGRGRQAGVEGPRGDEAAGLEAFDACSYRDIRLYGRRAGSGSTRGRGVAADLPGTAGIQGVHGHRYRREDPLVQCVGLG